MIDAQVAEVTEVGQAVGDRLQGVIDEEDAEVLGEAIEGRDLLAQEADAVLGKTKVHSRAVKWRQQMQAVAGDEIRR